MVLIMIYLYREAPNEVLLPLMKNMPTVFPAIRIKGQKGTNKLKALPRGSLERGLHSWSEVQLPQQKQKEL